MLQGFVDALDQKEDNYDEAEFERKIRVLKEIITEFFQDNPKLSEILYKVIEDIEKQPEKYLGQDVSVIINEMRYTAIDTEIKKYAEKWFVPFDDVKYEAFNFRDGVLANENKLKEAADYTAYKESTSDPLPKFKFRKEMIEDFKQELMAEIEPLMD